MILQFSTRQIQPGMTALSIKGSIHCGPECARLERQIEDLIGQRENRLILDMAGVSHIDSAAIGSLVRCLAKTKKAGGGLRMACAQPMVDYSMKLTKVDQLMPNYQSVEAAADGFLPAGTAQA